MIGSIGKHYESLACIRAKGGENVCFRIDSGVKQGHVPLNFQCIYGCSDERREN